MAAVEVRTPAREIAANGVSCRPAERHDSFLRSLAGRADDSLLEIDVGFREADCLADTEPGSVEELDERAVAERPGGRSRGGVDETFGLGR